MNAPNAVTLLRIFIVPLLVVVLLTRVSEAWFGVSQRLLGVAIFLVAALTDWLDGFLARRRRQVSPLGMLLDPLADKLLISAALIALVDNRLAPAWAVVIIIGREFAVTGLRSMAAHEGLVIVPSRMGKFKMLAEVVAVALLILSMTDEGGPPVTPYAVPVFWEAPAFVHVLARFSESGHLSAQDLRILLYSAGRAVLWLVVISSIWSMYGYFRQFYTFVRESAPSRHRVASASEDAVAPSSGRRLR
ncbi:CDP-diacylglycerol--glycerol-3-phosphate 3-phosphatidyltransferase [bacterium HR10]|nr:CDP-diacylglycerol--glycerol-3-phosphate 3-phosphatidyltransferase [bacterium HR10]